MAKMLSTMGKNGLVIGTFLPVTKGHQFLINFGLNYMFNLEKPGYLEVLINSRSIEPIPGEIRFNALKEHYFNVKNVMFRHCDQDDVPQNPTEHPDFWNIWKDLIRKHTDNKPGDYIIGSEKYCQKLAEVLECEFIPCDMHREAIDISGTRVRQDPIANFDQIMIEMQRYLRKTVTLFGPESVGKTTMSKRLANKLNGYFLPEWARTYLEEIGPEITEKKMESIVQGQFASQFSISTYEDKPFIFQDTDLLSTLGYYEIFKHTAPARAIEMFKKSKSDLYILMNDQVPFVPDVLRYGGDKRESDTNFWKEYLDSYDCKYHVVAATDPDKQFEEISAVVKEMFLSHDMSKFLRT